MVCLQDECSTVYKECGHLVCCEPCALRMQRCPLCRRRSDWIRIYRAGH